MNRRGSPWDRADKVLLIFEALRNKYRDLTDEQLLALVRAHVDGAAASASDGVHRAEVEQDIASQVRTLETIEAIAAGSAPERPDLVRWLQAELLGRFLADGDYRQDTFVDDFDGEPPVQVQNIPAALRELELLCTWAIFEARSLPLSGKAALLAYIYSSVIRIHPFRDANGRSARFLVQYALCRWGMALMPIPKVRNDPAWHHGLARAVLGEFEPLAAEFLRRLAEPPLGWPPRSTLAC